MRHRKGYKTLSIDGERRKHLLRNLAISLIENERIKTTDAKAKELVRFISKLVTMAKNDNLSSRRRALSKLNNNKKAVRKLFDNLAPRFASRNGGYVRRIKLGFRKGDAAPVSIVEFVEEENK
ncbi:50S ribosomal protein L17 [Hippea maritima]|uniref:Large ribosomal subunit protein bL17 n=1 Tax=Hippea maritima (strain ATCC 700847 / DSM 10411 / MH2) TaxID=760142 RepID=F2LXR3_HIPMA|nr:50S ribosomal protein L17 [Hippea maritima]AEA34304.1 50S ribosomal protein L17 [Hippea maritima DSM 10411]